MKFNSILLASLLSATAVVAHPEVLPRGEINRRSAMSKRCEGAAANLNKKRHAKQMEKRAWGSGNSTVEVTTLAPYFDVIQNDTCVLTPEVTAGPYVWPISQTLRQDMTEDQPGVPLWLDIGVLDMATCEPLENVLLSFWHCNATGSYSSFDALSPNIGFPDLLEELNITDFEIGKTDLHTGDSTWLRGMWPTDSEGSKCTSPTLLCFPLTLVTNPIPKQSVMEMKTIFPGFYIERAIHIHVQAFTDWTLYPNGTVASGNLVSTGQIYFDEALEQQIMALSPYSSHTEINRTTNAEDTVFSDDTVGGYNPILSVVAADGENVENGMVGYITVGVDTAAIEEQAYYW